MYDRMLLENGAVVGIGGVSRREREMVYRVAENQGTAFVPAIRAASLKAILTIF